jgi:two-component system, OmpR family, phosphate regulon response regulator PhoB
VVDDDARVRLLISLLVERAGHRAVEAADGDEALDLIALARPDLVLLDLRPPGRNGLEVCRRLRAAEAARSLPILMLAADGAPEARENALAAGADDYLARPFAVGELIARLRAWLGTA